MNVSLTSELEELVRQKVDSGRYRSASEVVREALRLLEERDRLHSMRLEALREEIQKGFDSGPATPLDMEDVIRRGRERLTAREQSESE